MAEGEAALRLATMADRAGIDALMKRSIAEIFPRFYDEAQTAASLEHISVVDTMLIDDGTYFVVEQDGDLVACGGWSRRDKLYTGSGEGDDDARPLDPETEPARVRAMFVRGDRTRRGFGTMILQASEAAAKAEGYRSLALMSTAPGVALYERYGFLIVERTTIDMPNGTTIAAAAMEKPVN